jgi:hypothetical protein
VAITPLTDKFDTLTGNGKVIDKLTPAGNTNQAIGPAWGWLSLGQNIPGIKAPEKASGFTYQEYIVLVSDGLNTQDRWYSDAASIDARKDQEPRRRQDLHDPDQYRHRKKCRPGIASSEELCE